MRTFLPVLMLYAAIHSGFAQAKAIEFLNPSFEDTPRLAHTPFGWYDCGFVDETPPDVHPNPAYNITTKAYDGKTYLGMVVRNNNTWEAVSQKLSQPMQKGYVYQLKIYLARSSTYMSITRLSDKPVNYDMPVRLRIFGGFSACDGWQFLAETPLIIHKEWKPYVLEFEYADEAYDHLILEAYYDEDISGPYVGNILVDHLSALIPVRWGASTPHKKAPKYTQRPIPVKNDSILNVDSSYFEDLTLENTIQPVSISETELANLVETYANRITFDDFGSLRRMLYKDEQTGKEKWVNLPLYTILEGLQQHPLTNLILVIVEKDADLAEKKKQSLKTALRNMGARNDQVIVRGWQENDAAKSWSGDPESGVLLRLIR